MCDHNKYSVRVNRAIDESESHDRQQCSTHLQSTETFQQAKRWIQDCLNSHPICGKGVAWYPTRLLDSGPLEVRDTVVVRLQETRYPTSDIEGRYMTLSYCWGLVAPLTLTKQTYSSLLAGSPLNKLPPAFRDAIRICRGVGIRYLWIDALCIFQDKDDLSDWQREASQMQHIYSNSFCTISAAVGEGSSSPILRSRHADALRYDELTINWEHKDGMMVESKYVAHHKMLWLNNVVLAPVNKRAWVLQERMLSPRVLYFTGKQMFWECFEKQACESQPRGLFRLAAMDMYTKALPSMDNDKSKVNTKEFLELLHNQWNTIVQVYSESHLTFPSDRLVAISAIARRFATYFEDEYVAGMWRQSLENDLLWVPALHVHPTAAPSAIYVAPSWSWASASAEGTLIFIYDKELFHPDQCKNYIDVEGVQLQYTSDSDHFGSLKSGSLWLRGHLQRIRLLVDSDLPDVSKLSSQEVEGALKMRKLDHYHIVHINDTHEFDRSRSAKVYLDRDPYKRFVMENHDGVLFCMLAHRYGTKLWTFLLLQVVDIAKGTFRRLGVMSVACEEANERAVFSRHKDEAGFSCVKYQDGQHTICII